MNYSLANDLGSWQECVVAGNVGKGPCGIQDSFFLLQEGDKPI